LCKFLLIPLSSYFLFFQFENITLLISSASVYLFSSIHPPPLSLGLGVPPPPSPSPTFLGLFSTIWLAVAYAGYLPFHYRKELRIISPAVVAGLHLVVDRWGRQCWWSLENSKDRKKDEYEERIVTASDVRNTETMLVWQQS